MSDLEHAIDHLEGDGNFDGAAAVRQMMRDNERYRRLLERRKDSPDDSRAPDETGRA